MTGAASRAGKVRAVLCLGACLAVGASFLEGVAPKDEHVYIAWAALVVLACIPGRWARAERAVRRTLLVVLVGASTATLTDVAARGFVRLAQRPEDIYARRHPPLAIVGRFAPGVRFEGEVHGDLAAMMRDPPVRIRRRVRFATDARGFRNDVEPDARPHDVVVLGDSFAFGSGTTQDETWVHRLTSEHGLAAYTMGFPGSPWQGCVNAQIDLPGVAVREGGALVFMLFSGNDLDDVWKESLDPAELGWPAPWWTQLQVRLESWRKRSPFHHLRRRSAAAEPGPPPVVTARTPGGAPALFYRQYVAAAARSREQVRAHPGYASVVASLRRARSLAEARGLRFVVVCAPTKAEVHPEALPDAGPFRPGAFAEEMAEVCRADGVPCLDLLPLLRAHVASGGGDVYWPDDTHWSPAGNEVVAREVARFLRADGGRRP